jgi:signal transduction histidine kinase
MTLGSVEGTAYGGRRGMSPMLPPLGGDAGPLDGGHVDDGQLPVGGAREVLAVGARQNEVQAELDRLRAEVDELRASRRRLVLREDEDRRAIERDLHGGVHQRLISLAVSLQLARQPDGRGAGPAMTSLLDELAGAVQDALEETAQLAQRIHPPTLEARDIAALLRSAAAAAGVSAIVEVTAGGSYPPEAVMTLHLCWLAALTRGSRTAIAVHDGADALVFEITRGESDSTADLDGMRERVEALGGLLAIVSSGEDGLLVTCSLPLVP